MIVEQNTLESVSECPSVYQEVWRQAECAIKRVRLDLRNWGEKQPDFAPALASLQRLPIALDRFALATRRLHNAECYFGEGETGAAIFELNLLYAAIQRDAECAKMNLPAKSRY